MRWLSIVVLLLALFWPSSEGYPIVLQWVVFAGAILVAWAGYRSAKQIWAIGFVAIAVLFNPFQPMTFSREILLWLNLISIATFLASFVVLKAKPSPSMPFLSAP